MGGSLMRDTAEGPPPRHVPLALISGKGIHAADTPRQNRRASEREARLSVFIVPAGETAAGSASITRQPLPPMTKGYPFERSAWLPPRGGEARDTEGVGLVCRRFATGQDQLDARPGP
jgi:hypothetical protein